MLHLLLLHLDREKVHTSGRKRLRLRVEHISLLYDHNLDQDNLFSLPRLWGQTSSAAAAPRKNNQQKNFRQDKGLCLFLTLEKKTPKFCGKKERVIFMGFWSRDRAAIYMSPKM